MRQHGRQCVRLPQVRPSHRLPCGGEACPGRSMGSTEWEAGLKGPACWATDALAFQCSTGSCCLEGSDGCTSTSPCSPGTTLPPATCSPPVPTPDARLAPSAKRRWVCWLDWLAAPQSERLACSVPVLLLLLQRNACTPWTACAPQTGDDSVKCVTACAAVRCNNGRKCVIQVGLLCCLGQSQACWW